LVGLAVGLAALQEHCLGGLLVRVLAHPRNDARLLEGFPVGERHVPREAREVGVHGVQVDGGRLLVVLVEHGFPRQEKDAGHGAGHGALEGGDGGGGHVFARGFRALEAGLNHVGLEDRALEEDTVHLERLELRQEHALGHRRARHDVWEAGTIA